MALCVLMVSHLNFDIFKWVWNSLGHTSFAELFVFMSGLVSGIVYWKLLNRTSAREVRARLHPHGPLAGNRLHPVARHPAGRRSGTHVRTRTILHLPARVFGRSPDVLHFHVAGSGRTSTNPARPSMDRAGCECRPLDCRATGGLPRPDETLHPSIRRSAGLFRPLRMADPVRVRALVRRSACRRATSAAAEVARVRVGAGATVAGFVRHPPPDLLRRLRRRGRSRHYTPPQPRCSSAPELRRPCLSGGAHLGTAPRLVRVALARLSRTALAAGL
ncbi:MAG: OpgC domain-containing protein [Deltaproteobacteria bacterium]|nr:OpgC domain-containing protein [Deltaproteobacteria bacterium]